MVDEWEVRMAADFSSALTDPSPRTPGARTVTRATTARATASVLPSPGEEQAVREWAVADQ